jgi:hypothetical protein
VLVWGFWERVAGLECTGGGYEEEEGEGVEEVGHGG